MDPGHVARLSELPLAHGVWTIDRSSAIFLGRIDTIIIFYDTLCVGFLFDDEHIIRLLSWLIDLQPQGMAK